eukprot:ANDGO_03895.mRNA.1 Flowering time control protein FY
MSFQAEYNAEGFDQRPKQRYDGRTSRAVKEKKTFDIANGFIWHQKRAGYGPIDFKDSMHIAPDPFATQDLPLPADVSYAPWSSVCTHLGRVATNQVPAIVYCHSWYPDGRVLITGNAKGEFTMWYSHTFSFVTIQDSHLKGACRSMSWSRSGFLLISGDATGEIKFWTPQLTEVACIGEAHQDAVRGLSFAPSDLKFASASDDGKVRLWDVKTQREECTWPGHGTAVKTVEWHPSASLVASGGQDSVIRLWDPRASAASSSSANPSAGVVSALYEHRGIVHRLKWNPINGNWLLSVSRDQSARVFDIRTMKSLQVMSGSKEYTACNWHPIHESLCCAGTYDGVVRYWMVGVEEPLAEIAQAHEQSIWDMCWHPAGHCMATAGNDRNVKFWVRNRPGSNLMDYYNAPSLPEPLRREVMDAARSTRAPAAQIRKVSQAVPSLETRDRRNMPTYLRAQEHQKIRQQAQLQQSNPAPPQ